MLINIKDKRKWGYYNSETKHVIPCRFCESSDFVDGFAIVRTDYNSSYGVIDENGKEIIPLKYSEIKKLDNGVFELRNSSYTKETCLCNSEGLLIDEKGNVLEDEFQKYDIVCKLDEDLFFVSKDKKKGIIFKEQLIIEYEDNRFVDEIKCGLILFSNGNGSRWLYNLKGEAILEGYNYFDITPNSYVIFSGRHKRGMGIADSKGNIIVKPIYWNINYLHDNLFKLIYQKDLKGKSYEVLYDSSNRCFIEGTETSNIQIPAHFDWCGNNNGQFLIFANDYKFGIIDKNCTIISDCIYTEIKECFESTAIVKKEGKWQLLNLSDGKLSAEYDDISHLKGDFYVFCIKYEYGVIDKNGKSIVPARFNQDIEALDDGTFKVSKGYSPRIFRIIDKEGHIIIKPRGKNIILPKEITWVYNYSEGYAIVENSDKIKGTIDMCGNMIIPFKFRGELSDFKKGESVVTIWFDIWGNNKKTSKIDTDGNFICKHDTSLLHIKSDCYLVSDFIGDRAIAYDGKHWGLVDTNGNKLSEFKYDDISYLYNGFYKVIINNRCGIIDYLSKVYLPCKYLNVRLTDNDCFEAITKEERWRNRILESMIINHDGYIVAKCGNSEILIPQEYDFVYSFEGNYAKVVSNNKWGLINNQGENILPCKYSFLDQITNDHVHVRLDDKDYIISLVDNDTFEIENATNAIYYGDDCIVITDNLGALKVYGIINRKGDIIRKADYDEIGPFIGNYAYISRSEYPYKNKKYGIINKKGDVIIEPQYYSLKFNDSNSALVAVSSTLNNNCVYKNIDFNNNTILLNGQSMVKLPKKYSHGRDFCEGIAAVAIADKKNNANNFYDNGVTYKWGFINVKGEDIVECVYDNVTDFAHGFSVVTQNRLKGVINIIGDVVIPIEYDDIVLITNDIIKVNKNGGTGLINYKNEMVIPLNYFDVLEPSEGYIPISINGLWGYIDYHNKLIIKAKYASVHSFHEGLAAVFDKSFWKFIDKNGNEIITIPKDFNVGDFEDGVASVSFVSEDGCTITHKLLRNGHFLINGVELSIDSSHIRRVYHFHEGLAKVLVDDSWGFINTNGEVVISGILNNVTDFKNGYAKLLDDNCEELFINKFGNLVIFEKDEPISFPKDYYSVRHFGPNLYMVKRLADDYIGIVNKYCRIIVPFTEDNIQLILSEKGEPSYIKISDEWNDEEGRYVFYNLSGDRIIPDNGDFVIIKQNYGKTGSTFSSGLVAVSRDNLWGFVNRNGVEIIPCQYYDVKDFEGDYCIVLNEEYNKSVINKKGVMVFPYREYGSISFVNEGFKVAHAIYGKEDRYQSYDDNWDDDNWESEWVPEERKLNHKGELQVSLYGEIIYLPKKYDWCTSIFKEGFMAVHSNGKWGVINANLTLIIECLYDKPIEFEDGIALTEKDDQTYAFDTSGKTLFSGKYKSVKRYKDEHMFVCLTADRTRFDIYNDSGKLLFYSNDIKSRIIIQETDNFSVNSFSPSRIIPLDIHHLKFAIRANYKSKRILKWGLSDAKGDIVLEAKYDDINGIGSGLIAVCKEFINNRHLQKLWGYVDIHGTLVVDYKYSEALPFFKGVAIVAKKETRKNGFSQTKYGLLGSNGKELTSFVYDSAKRTERGIEVSDHSHKNLISFDGEILFNYYDDNDGWTDGHVRGYDWCSDGHNGFHVVTKGDLQGIINDFGEETFELTDLGQIKIDFDEEERLVLKNYVLGAKEINEFGQIKSRYYNKEIFLPKGIQWCKNWLDNYLPVMSNGKWGLLNSNMSFIIAPRFDKIQYILNEKVLCINNNENNEELFIYDITKETFKQLDYDKCSEFEDGCAIVSKGDNNKKKGNISYGIIDNNGVELVPCIYQYIQFREPPKEKHINSYDYNDPYENYTREDSLMDALDGQMDAYWNID